MSCFESAWDIVRADLPRPQKLMLNIYWLHCNRKSGTAYISLARLAALMCSTRTTTIKARKALVDKGLLVKKGEKFQCTVYGLGTEALKAIAIPDPKQGTGTVRPPAMKGTAFEAASTANAPNVVHLLDPNSIKNSNKNSNTTEEQADACSGRLTPEQGWSEFCRIRKKYNPKQVSDLAWHRWKKEWLRAIKEVGDMDDILKAWEMLWTDAAYKWWREVPRSPFQAFLRVNKIKGFVQEYLDREAERKVDNAFPVEMLEDTNAESSARLWIARNRPSIQLHRHRGDIKVWLKNQVTDVPRVLRLLGVK